ncbi:P-loop NTPase fold protein [Pseudochelatococcus sp. G4_1912]|uniref:P-loop NTPase fold protein n=1 Tax=Pseudochelatococcus sp. G4_1912 TaxID=3114288 RepID=UPI0039C67309
MSTASRLQIENYLKKWVNSSDNPKFAVLLDGPWGSGKTFFIDKILKKSDFTDKKRIYISLFGIANIQDFERQLFYAGLSRTKKLLHKGTNLCTSAISSTLNISSGNILQGSVNISKAVNKIIDQTIISNDSISNSFIVIDDLERCNFSIPHLMGVINNYIEHGNARVIIVANSQKIKSKKFLQFREKIIGQYFELPPDPEAAIDVIIQQNANHKVRKIIELHSPQIKELYSLSKINNLRALYQFIAQLNEILLSTNEKYINNNNLIRSLIEQLFIFFMEYKLNLDESIERLTPDNLLPEFGADDPENRFFYVTQTDTKETPSSKARIIQKYKVGPWNITVITIKQWISILSTGIIDKEWFNKELSSASEVSGMADWPSWKRLWHLYQQDFSVESHSQFENDITEIIANINNGKYIDPRIFLHVAGVLLMLSKEELITEDAVYWQDHLIKYIDEKIYPNLSLEFYDAMHNHIAGFSGSGYEELGYAEKNSKEFREIIDHLNRCIAKWYANWQEKDVGTFLLTKMKNNYYDFLGELIVINGCGTQRFYKTPILTAIPPKDFVDAWTTLPRMQENILIENLKKRYQNQHNLLEQESSWWEKIQVELHNYQKKIIFPPRAVQIKYLINNVGDILQMRDELG